MAQSAKLTTNRFILTSFSENQYSTNLTDPDRGIKCSNQSDMATNRNDLNDQANGMEHVMHQDHENQNFNEGLFL